MNEILKFFLHSIVNKNKNNSKTLIIEVIITSIKKKFFLSANYHKSFLLNSFPFISFAEKLFLLFLYNLLINLLNKAAADQRKSHYFEEILAMDN
jgi:hypothetical protein